MEKCSPVAGQGRKWTFAFAAELKDDEIAWNVVSGSQSISLLAFWLLVLIKEDQNTEVQAKFH